MATADQKPGLDRSKIYNADLETRRHGGHALVSSYLKEKGGELIRTARLDGSQGIYVAETFPFLDSPQSSTSKGLEGRGSDDNNSKLDRRTLVDSPESGVILFTVTLPSYSSMLDNLDRASTSRDGIPVPPRMTTSQLIRLKAIYGEDNLEYLARAAFIDPTQAKSLETVALATHPETDYGARVATTNPFKSALALMTGRKVLAPREVDPGNPTSDLVMGFFRSIGRGGTTERWGHASDFAGFKVFVRVANVDQRNPS